MTQKPQQRRGLGRGLGSLIPTAPRPEESAPANGARPPTARSARRLDGDGTGVPRSADWIGAMDEPGEPTGPQADGQSTARRTGTAAPRPEPTRGAETGADTGGPDLRPVEGAHFAELPVTSIAPNPRQPRQVFDEEAMAELVHSIKEIGLLQPVVVRPAGEGRYELIMGERRWRATQEAGLDTIPAIVRETGDDALLRDALLENLHRSELNPLEEAAAYQQLLDDFGCTHEELATRIGRSRPQISNTLRLLRLSPAVQRRVAAGVLSAGHARALLGVEDARGPGPARGPGGGRGHLGAWPRGDRRGRRPGPGDHGHGAPEPAHRAGAGRPGGAAVGPPRDPGQGRPRQAQGPDHRGVRLAARPGADRRV